MSYYTAIGRRSFAGTVLLLLCFQCAFREACYGAIQPEHSFRAWGILKNVQADGVVGSEYKFSVQIQGPKWFVRTEEIGSKTSGIDYYEDSYDGENVFSYIQFQKEGSSVNTSAAVIERNDVPYEKARYMTAVWLAYGSAYYFERVTNSVKLFFDLDDSHLRIQDKYRMRVDLEKSRGLPPIPTRIDFYSDGRVYHRKQGQSYSAHEFAPYDKGFLSKRFQVTAFTNASGYTLPSEFELKWYFPDSNGKSTNDIHLVFTQKGQLIGLECNSEQREFVPKTDSKTYVEDRRFAQIDKPVNQVIYLSTNSGWTAMTNSALQRIYAETAENDRLNHSLAKSHEHRTGWGITLVIGMNCVALLAFSKMKGRKGGQC
ncbi:MAG: hypothetical protein ACTHLW_21580 [Verrucomicrobiota bacterium]